MPILSILLPIETLVSPVQPENAEEPMLVTLSGIVMLVGLVQFSNAPLRIVVTVSILGEYGGIIIVVSVQLPMPAM